MDIKIRNGVFFLRYKGYLNQKKSVKNPYGSLVMALRYNHLIDNWPAPSLQKDQVVYLG